MSPLVDGAGARRVGAVTTVAASGGAAGQAAVVESAPGAWSLVPPDAATSGDVDPERAKAGREDLPPTVPPAVALVRRLYALGARLVTDPAEPDRLRVRVKKGRITPQLHGEIAEHKAAILAHLAALRAVPTYPCIGCGRFSLPRPRHCFWCVQSGAGGGP